MNTTSNRIFIAVLIFVAMLTGCLKVDGMHVPTKAQLDQWFDVKLGVSDGR